MNFCFKTGDRNANFDFPPKNRYLCLLFSAILLLLTACGTNENVAAFREKANLLREEALADWVRLELGTAPAGTAGHAVFLSVCDTAQRAKVFTGTGETPDAAWDAASIRAEAAVKDGLSPVWVKADVVYLSETVSAGALAKAVKSSRQDFFRRGAAFDAKWDTALLEQKLNGAKSYEYEEGGVDLKSLNTYLEKAGRKPLEALPDTYTLFQCAGWIYDGEAAFALCRLYGLTGEARWLEAAKSTADHFIAANYAQYKDHWVAYAMNELTKYVPDDPAYYAFALENAQVNLEEIYRRDNTYHTYLELLMATFEVYGRMMDMGASVEGFDKEMFLRTIYARADRQLNGYFYPECAMYMANPQRVLDTFMVRHDGCRVRIDDVQHNIGGYYLYAKNYDKLVSCGLLEARD